MSTLAALQEALASEAVETIIVTETLTLPDGTSLVSTSLPRKTVQVEKPFLPEDGAVSVSGTTLVSPADGDYSTYKLFNIEKGSHVVISNLTMMGGYTDTRTANYNAVTGGIDCYGELEMYACDILRTGRALYVQSTGKALLENCNIVRNAAWYGGGILNDGTLVMEKCSLTENQSLGSGHGGGAMENHGVACINNSVIANNASTEIGGGINNSSNGRLYIMNSTLVGNVTTIGTQGGAAIGNSDTAKELTIVNCYMAYNYYANGSNLTADSIAAWSSGSTVNLTVVSTVYDGTTNVSSSRFDDDCSTTYAPYMSNITTNGINAAGYSGGTTTAFPHPGLYSVDPVNNPYSLQPVVMVAAGYSAPATTATYFDYSHLFETNGEIGMSYDKDGTNTALGEKVVASNESVSGDFDDEDRDGKISIGAIVIGEDQDPAAGTPFLFWIQLGDFTGGKVSGVSVYRDMYAEGTIVYVTAAANSAYYLAGWTLNGVEVPDSAQQYLFSFAIHENTVIAPIFKPVKTEILAVRQRYPWNNLVDIDFGIAEDDAADYRLVFQATYTDEAGAVKTIQLMSFVDNAGKDESGVYTAIRLGDQSDLRKAGQHRVTWDSAKDGVRIKNGSFAVRLLAVEGTER